MTFGKKPEMKMFWSLLKEARFFWAGDSLEKKLPVA